MLDVKEHRKRKSRVKAEVLLLLVSSGAPRAAAAEKIFFFFDTKFLGAPERKMKRSSYFSSLHTADQQERRAEDNISGLLAISEYYQ